MRKETEHLVLNSKADDKGNMSLNTTDLKEAFNWLIGSTARSVSDAEIETAFDAGFAEWRH